MNPTSPFAASVADSASHPAPDSAAHPAPDPASARGALARLRQDLFTDIFAMRPLPPLPESGGRVLPYLPPWLRSGARWTPHGAVYTIALVLFLFGTASSVSFGGLGGLLSLALCLLITMPIAMVLFRPVGAYWMSFVATAFALVYQVGGGPWMTIGFISHLLVMVVVVLRTRPRLAAEMWLLGFAMAAVLTAFLGDARGGLPVLGAGSGLVMVAAAAVRAWRDEHRHAVETETVTAKERAHRTLLEERATIARELHDVVAHHMSVVAIQAEAAPYRVKDTPPELEAAFGTIRENAVAALTELRSILGLVRAGGTDAFGGTDPEAPQPTLADLDRLLDSVRETGLEAEGVVTGAARPLPQGVELSAYRLVQEALSNALRHSPGAVARVEVSYVLGGLGLRVVNGPPNRLAKPSPGAGHGVLGMRERTQMLGGEMTAGHTEDGGFEVAAFFPVPPAAREAGRDGGQNAGRDGDREAGRDGGRDAGREAATDAGREAARSEGVSGGAGEGTA